ncbi:hypothetical protein BJ742DRAFT_819078 [Cladochytrium replicatum]|nr:hypothetical protein BJ742DRAFT_819078 [Cladochytrium replicatum]
MNLGDFHRQLITQYDAECGCQIGSTEVIGLVLVSAFWGFTNPFIKNGSKGLEDVTAKHIKMGSSWWTRNFAEMRFLFTRWQYVVPLLINLSGSAVYYRTLGSADISIAVPITSSLTFVWTFLAGLLLGEEVGTTRL